MYPVVKDYILASADQVAIDAVAAKMMGFDPMSIEYIRVAHEDHLGTGDPRDIEIVGADISNESWGFSVGDNGASIFGDLLWFGPLAKVQNLFTHTPLVGALILGSEVYHDYYRWPFKDRKIFEHWLSHTQGANYSSNTKAFTPNVQIRKNFFDNRLAMTRLMLRRESHHLIVNRRQGSQISIDGA